MLNEILQVVDIDTLVVGVAAAIGTGVVLAGKFLGGKLIALVRKTPTQIDDKILDTVLAKIEEAFAKKAEAETVKEDAPKE